MFYEVMGVAARPSQQPRADDGEMLQHSVRKRKAPVMTSWCINNCSK